MAAGDRNPAPADADGADLAVMAHAASGRFGDSAPDVPRFTAAFDAGHGSGGVARSSSAAGSDGVPGATPVSRTRPVCVRIQLLLTAVVVAWVVLLVRVLTLSVPGEPTARERVQRQQTVTVHLPARPGDIVDRSGEVLLATTVVRPSLYVVPAQIVHRWQLARRLAGVLHLDAAELFARLDRNRDKQFLWVKRRLSEEQRRRVEAMGLPPGTYGFRDEYLRVYPQGTLACHVLGWRDIDGVGRAGVERSCGELLRGRDGRRVLRVDALRKAVAVDERASVEPAPGATVRLTIDAAIQRFAETRLDAVMEQWRPISATAVVLEPSTGEVLAMANRPAFDPNRPARGSAGWTNRAIQSRYEPGSTIKPFVVAEAVRLGRVRPDEPIDCEHGVYRIGGRVLHDHHPYGTLSVTDVLVKSSNIGMAKIVGRLSREELHGVLARFGFGRPTGIELPGEASGLLRGVSEWSRYSAASLAMGQELTATPLQVTVAYAALANRGRRVVPRIIAAVDGRMRVSFGGAVTPVLSETVSDWLVRGPLADVVTRGTGRRAKIAEFRIAGKSGTAQKVDPDGGGYSSRKHVSSFVCLGPVEAPRAVVLVLVDEPSVGDVHYGGLVAGPAAAEILRFTLLRLGVSPENVPRTAAERRGGRRR
ncbi:MAG: penicillin-binding protein 2 [Planctomycetota bacterium]|nr:MAG: penicillin-binding protein 2 [Planctomycetota bacterium]